MKYGTLMLAYAFLFGILVSACDDEQTDTADADAADVQQDTADVEDDATDVSLDLAPDEQDQGEIAPTLALTGAVSIGEPIDASEGSAYLVILVPDDFVLADGFDDPGLPAESLALFSFPVASGYDGSAIDITAEIGLFREIDMASPTMMGDPWEEAEVGSYGTMYVFLMGGEPSHMHLEAIEVAELPEVIDVGAIGLHNLGTPPDSSCAYTQTIAYVDGSVDGSLPCSESDGTCISGEVSFFSETITISEGDVGEAYLFGSPSGPPLIIFEQVTPTNPMPFRIPNIPAAATDSCTEFQVGGRLDVGGNNHGRPGGPEDPTLVPILRIPISLEAGDQIDGLDFTIF